MVQKETLSSLTHGNFAKELSISQGKVPPNAVEFEKLVIGTIDSTTHTIPQPTCLLNIRNIPPATISPAITNFMYLFIPKSF